MSKYFLNLLPPLMGSSQQDEAFEYVWLQMVQTAHFEQMVLLLQQLLNCQLNSVLPN